MIKQYRKNTTGEDGKCMTQAALARKLQVSQKYVSELERGIYPVTRIVAQKLNKLDPDHFDNDWVAESILREN